MVPRLDRGLRMSLDYNATEVQVIEMKKHDSREQREVADHKHFVVEWGRMTH